MTEENNEKKERKDLTKWTSYCIMIDLSKFPFFEELEHECDDGVVRFGAFIPYEENNVYPSDKGRFMPISAEPCSRRFRSSTLSRFIQTHALHPFWNKALEKKMNGLGYYRKSIWLGNMSSTGKKTRR